MGRQSATSLVPRNALPALAWFEQFSCVSSGETEVLPLQATGRLFLP